MGVCAWEYRFHPAGGSSGLTMKMEEIPLGTSQLVTVEGKEVALFNVEGQLYAVGNRCPHRSGPLVRGHVEKVEDALAVRCPIHGWLFELATGRCLTRPSASTPSYPVTCKDGEIAVGETTSGHPELVEG